jgi:hypothetical protein
MALVYDGMVFVEYTQAMVLAGGEDYADLEEYFAGQINGLAGAAQPGYVQLFTATHTGGVHFIVEVLESEPLLRDEYGDVVEVSLVPLDRQAMLAGLMGERACEFDLPAPCYRVRYSCKDLDEAREWDTMGDWEELVARDSFVLELWPAPPAADAIVRQTSSFAEYHHSQYGSVESTTFPKEVRPPDPSEDWNAVNRHAALKWLVTQAGISAGIGEDPAFQRALYDSDDVLADFMANPDRYQASLNGYGWREVPVSAVQESALERLGSRTWRDEARHDLLRYGGFLPSTDEEADQEALVDDDGDEGDANLVQEGTVTTWFSRMSPPVVFGQSWSGGQDADDPEVDDPEVDDPDVDRSVYLRARIVEMQNAPMPKPDAVFSAWSAVRGLLTYYGYEFNRDQQGQSKVYMDAEDALGLRAQAFIEMYVKIRAGEITPDDPRATADAVDPMTPADPVVLHEALVWVVTRAVESAGFADDPVFVRAIEDSRLVLAEFAQSGAARDYDTYWSTNPPVAVAAAERTAGTVEAAWSAGMDRPFDTRPVDPIWKRYMAWDAVARSLEAPYSEIYDIQHGAWGVLYRLKEFFGDSWPEVEAEFHAHLTPNN